MSRAEKGKIIREKEYYELLRRELEKRAGENADITIRDVRKNNGVYRKACTVRFNDAQVAPTVYLEPYYDQFAIAGAGHPESLFPTIFSGITGP